MKFLLCSCNVSDGICLQKRCITRNQTINQNMVKKRELLEIYTWFPTYLTVQHKYGIISNDHLMCMNMHAKVTGHLILEY